VLALASRFPGVAPAVGLHPERLEPGDADIDAVEEQALAHRPDLAAIGEIGLPWYSLEGRSDAAEISTRARDRLTRLLALARRLDLPVSLHAPHAAAAEALALVIRSGAGPVVFHWHKADRATTQAIVAAGHFLGVTPEVAYRERDQTLVREVPLAQLLVESDGPWSYRGGVGEPAMVAQATRSIGEVRGVAAGLVMDALADNARRCFGR
jgi:TatD DNase family protein